MKKPGQNKHEKPLPAKKWEIVIYSLKYLKGFSWRPMLYQKILWAMI